MSTTQKIYISVGSVAGVIVITGVVVYLVLKKTVSTVSVAGGGSGAIASEGASKINV